MTPQKLSTQDTLLKEMPGMLSSQSQNGPTEHFEWQKLPTKYPKASYKWCLDWKSMGKVCWNGKVPRTWTREKMNAYLDWDEAEDARVEVLVKKDIEANGFRTEERGPDYLWKQAERGREEQKRLHEEQARCKPQSR
jgi:hypothetical protein